MELVIAQSLRPGRPESADTGPEKRPRVGTPETAGVQVNVVFDAAELS